MIKLQDFETVTCDHAKDVDYIAFAKECENPNDDFLPYRRIIRYVTHFLGQCFTGQLNCFPITYWLLLIWTLPFTFHCLYRFRRIYCEYLPNDKSWRNQHFYVLPATLLRNCQMLVWTVKLSAWLLMLSAVVNVSPKLCELSLMVQVFLCCCKTTRLLLEALIGKVKANKPDMVVLGVNLVTLLLISFAKSIFEHEVEQQSFQNSPLWRKVLVNYKLFDQKFI